MYTVLDNPTHALAYATRCGKRRSSKGLQRVEVTHAHMIAHACTHTYTHTHAYTLMHSDIHTYTHIHNHAYTHIHTQTHTHAHTHTHTHAHTHARAHTGAASWGPSVLAPSRPARYDGQVHPRVLHVPHPPSEWYFNKYKHIYTHTHMQRVSSQPYDLNWPDPHMHAHTHAYIHHTHMHTCITHTCIHTSHTYTQHTHHTSHTGTSTGAGRCPGRAVGVFGGQRQWGAIKAHDTVSGFKLLLIGQAFTDWSSLNWLVKGSGKLMAQKWLQGSSDWSWAVGCY